MEERDLTRSGRSDRSRSEENEEPRRQNRSFDRGQSEDSVDDPLFAKPRESRADERRTSEPERNFREQPLRFVDRDKPAEDAIVDVDFEDIALPADDEEGGDEVERGFGRKVRAERRRATALAKIDELDPVAERVFNDEFFAALRVQPKELERAIRKARRRAEAREKNRLTPFRAVGWSAWAGAVAATAFVVVAYKDAIVARIPRAADAYAVIGVDAGPKGLKIEKVNHRLAMSTGGPTIEITGALRNEGETPLPTPLMQAEALGAKGELLARWTFSLEASEIAKGGIAEFATRARAPDGVVEVALSFAPDKPLGK